MTEPVQNQHYSVSSKPALKSGKGSDRTPYGEKVNPVGFSCFVHLSLLSLNMRVDPEAVNGH